MNSIVMSRFDIKMLRQFGLIFAGMLCVMFGLFLPWVFSYSLPTWPWITAVLFIIMAILRPNILQYIYIPWMRFGGLLGKLNTRLILGLIFYGIFMPTALIMRIIGRDPMNKQIETKNGSYFIESKCKPNQHMENPY